MLAHLARTDDALVAVRPLLDRVPHFADLVATASGEVAPTEFAALRAAETIGRPLGDEAFVARIESAVGRTVRPGKRGRKPLMTAEGDYRVRTPSAAPRLS